MTEISFWERLNSLVPNPQCTTRGNLITSWSDSRTKPTKTAIKNVDVDTLLLAKVKAEYKRQIDEAAETSRLQFITPGAGQAIVYELKRAEIAAKQGGAADVDLPFMASRAARKGQTTDDVFAEWDAKSNYWLSKAVEIEDLREGAKEAVEALADAANAETDAIAIAMALVWPTV